MDNRKYILSKDFDATNIAFDIFNALGEGINIVDENGIFLYCNNKSAEYVSVTPGEMIGHHISEFYPQAALINVLKTGKNIKFEKVVHDNGKIYDVRAYPLFFENELIGGFAIFKDVTEIERLNKKIEELELQATLLTGEDIFSSIVGWNISLKNSIIKAKKSIGALGGPRHSIITGESGTGKTMLARTIYYYAKNIGVLKEDAPFIEVNCAQYTNSDIAAMEVFGSHEGAYTGSKDKKGLFELANGGILFLDEAHTLDEYQNLLLKVIESGHVRRIGGVKDIKVNVIVIAASTKDLKTVLVPELYQRLAQNELHLPPLRDRTDIEKYTLLNVFINKYEESAKDRYGINLKVGLDPEAQAKLIKYHYPRNIRQFRDVINASIDSAVPLISPDIEKDITTIVTLDNIPEEVIDVEDDEYIIETSKSFSSKESIKEDISDMVNNKKMVDSLIIKLSDSGLGPRRIANILNEKGIDIKYYQVAYRLKKKNK
ncbi:MAG: sigma 54-interacting transcriptional regulator [Tissierellaceae bacterium]|nr:sigma 54-interacting transcriptional regulator [Tissierellaceae bacterium]